MNSKQGTQISGPSAALTNGSSTDLSRDQKFRLNFKPGRALRRLRSLIISSAVILIQNHSTSSYKTLTPGEGNEERCELVKKKALVVVFIKNPLYISFNCPLNSSIDVALIVSSGILFHSFITYCK